MDIYHTMTQEVSSQLKKNILLCQKESEKKEQEEKKKELKKMTKKSPKMYFADSSELVKNWLTS